MAKIKIYQDPISENVVAELETKDELYAYAKEHSVFADQVEIDGQIYYGWDEIAECLE